MTVSDTDQIELDRKLTKRFSASRLKTWMACPLQAHFHYDQALPELQNAKATYGTCVHEALRLYNQTADVELAINRFKELWRNPERINCAPDWWPKGSNYQNLLERGVEVLTRYHEQLAWDQRYVVATEHPFLVRIGEFELTGYIDLIEVRKSGRGKTLVKIIDYKGGSYAPTVAQLTQDVQFTAYLYAFEQPEFWTGSGDPNFPGLGLDVQEQIKGFPRRAIWYHLNNQRELDAGPRTQKDFERLYRVCKEVQRAELAQVFVPKIGESCGLCSYTKECSIDIPSREQLVEDPNAWL